MFACLGKGIDPKFLADGYLSGVDVPYVISPNRFGVPEDLGLAYLKNVPATASARVAAMRARIGKTPPPMVSFPKTDVGDIADASFQNLQKIGQRVLSVYEDASQYDVIASSFGIPVAEVKVQASQIAAASKGSQPEFIASAMKYAPAASVLGNAVFAYAKGGGVNRAELAGALGMAVANAVGDVAPLVGTVVSMAASLYTASELARQKLVASVCVGFKDNYTAVALKTGQEGFPVPLHLLSDVGAPCTDERSDYDKILFIESVMKGNHLTFRALSPTDKQSVLEWWGLSLTLMSHPDVYAVFDKLGHGRAYYSAGFAPPFGDGYGRRGSALYGGLLASDEQVMMVAAPVAIANGYPVDYFAEALWKKSKGWRGADPSSMVVLEKGLRFDFNSTGDVMDTVTYYACPGFVANAYWLQLAALSRDAFGLVKTLKKPVEELKMVTSLRF